MTTGISLPESSTDPVAVANNVQVYCKDTAGVSQLFARSDDGSVSQLSGVSAGMSIGGAITGATAGSVLFAGVAGVLAQDNANLFWDNTNNRLGIGTTTPAWPLHILQPNAASICGRVRASSTSSYSAIEYYEASNIVETMMGWGNALVAFTHYRNTSFIHSPNTDIVFGNASINMIQFGVGNGAGAAYIDMESGQSSAALSTAARVRIRYNHSTIKFQVSMNAGAFQDFVTTVGGAAFIQGSVIFQGTGGNLQQDNANFFWDDTNNRLGIGTAAPATRIHVVGDSQFFDGQIYSRRDHATGGPAFFQNNNAANTGPSAVGFLSQAGVFKSYFGHFPSAYAFTYMQNKNGVLAFTGENIVFGNATVLQNEFGMTAGSAFFTMADGASAAMSASNTMRLRYDDGNQAPQISFDGSSYFDIALLNAALTNGSVLFASAGRISEDNANLNWDNTNNRLGIGTSAPSAALHVTTGSRFDAAIDLSNIAAGSPNLNITATSDTPTVTWGAAAGNEASTTPAGYLEIVVGGSPRYIPFWA
jgi:hypothetical protein